MTIARKMFLCFWEFAPNFLLPDFSDCFLCQIEIEKNAELVEVKRTHHNFTYLIF